MKSFSLSSPQHGRLSRFDNSTNAGVGVAGASWPPLVVAETDITILNINVALDIPEDPPLDPDDAADVEERLLSTQQRTRSSPSSQRMGRRLAAVSATKTLPVTVQFEVGLANSVQPTRTATENSNLVKSLMEVNGTEKIFASAQASFFQSSRQLLQNRVLEEGQTVRHLESEQDGQHELSLVPVEVPLTANVAGISVGSYEDSFASSWTRPPLIFDSTPRQVYPGNGNEFRTLIHIELKGGFDGAEGFVNLANLDQQTEEKKAEAHYWCQKRPTISGAKYCTCLDTERKNNDRKCDLDCRLCAPTVVKTADWRAKLEADEANIAKVGAADASEWWTKSGASKAEDGSLFDQVFELGEDVDVSGGGGAKEVGGCAGEARLTRRTAHLQLFFVPHNNYKGTAKHNFRNR